jgi:general stress protein 26
MFDNTENNLAFLKEKINLIKIALFKSEINSELQLPNNIIQTLRVEDDGTVWFFTTCNGNYARFINKSFYAYLDYYKKDTGCRLQLSGKAQIVDNEYDSTFSGWDGYSKEGYTSVLVKMKPMQAEFFENKITADFSWPGKIKNVFNSLFLSPAHRSYHFS